MNVFEKAKALASDLVVLEKDEVQRQRELVEEVEETRAEVVADTSVAEAHAEVEDSAVGWEEAAIDFPTEAGFVETDTLQEGVYSANNGWAEQEPAIYDASAVAVQEAGDGWGEGAYEAQAYYEGDASSWQGNAEAAGTEHYEGYNEQWVQGAPQLGESTTGVYEAARIESAATVVVPDQVQSPQDIVTEPWGSPSTANDMPGEGESTQSVVATSDPVDVASGETEGEGLSKLARLTKRVKEQQQRIKRMEQQAFLDGQKIHDLRESLAKKDADVAPTMAALERHKKELASLKSEAAEICKGAVLSWQIRAEQAERDLDEAQRMLKQRDSDRDLLRQDLRDAEDAFRRKGDRLEAELLESRQEIELLRATNMKLEHSLAETTQQLREKGEEVRRLQEEVWRKQEDVLTLQRQNQELGESGLQAKYRTKLEETERCHKRALDMVTQKMLQEVETLKQELEQAHAEKEQLARHQEDFRTFLKPNMRGVTRPAPQPATAAPAKPAPDPSVDTELAVKWDYLRGILLQFLQNSDPGFRRRLLPIIATVLRLDHFELHSIYMANRQWVVEPDYAGCGTFFSAFLRPAAR